MVEEFANDYGLTMVVKDKVGNIINDYGSYLNEVVITQNRTGKIASGVAFTVSIDVNTSKYNLIVNYVEKSTGIGVDNPKTIIKKDGDNGTETCPVIKGYVAERSSVSYEINGSDVTINCYYTKELVNSEPVVDDAQE